MKHLFVLICSFVASSAFSKTDLGVRNPMMQTCWATEGQFLVLDTTFDQLGGCTYGDALIDSLSILEVTFDEKKSQSIKALESTVDWPIEECVDWDGTLITGQIPVNGPTVSVCYFDDDSWIEVETLRRGLLDSQNEALKKAIETRFQN